MFQERCHRIASIFVSRFLDFSNLSCKSSLPRINNDDIVIHEHDDTKKHPEGGNPADGDRVSRGCYTKPSGGKAFGRDPGEGRVCKNHYLYFLEYTK